MYGSSYPNYMLLNKTPPDHRLLSSATMLPQYTTHSLPGATNQQPSLQMVAGGLLSGVSYAPRLMTSPGVHQLVPQQSMHREMAKPRADRLEVCDKYANENLTCPRPETECERAHPPDYVLTENNLAIVCMDFVKGICSRTHCKYYHPTPKLLDRVNENRAALAAVNQANTQAAQAFARVLSQASLVAASPRHIPPISQIQTSNLAPPISFTTHSNSNTLPHLFSLPHQPTNYLPLSQPHYGSPNPYAAIPLMSSPNMSGGLQINPAMQSLVAQKRPRDPEDLTLMTPASPIPMKRPALPGELNSMLYVPSHPIQRFFSPKPQ